MKASNIDITGPTSFLLKGPYGFGKTLAAASFALAGPTYLAYWDKKKPVELVTYFKKFGEKGKRILDNLEFDIYSAENANKYLEKVIDLKENCKYTAFITDSITMMTAGVVGWSLGFNEKGKKVKQSTDNPQQIIPSWDEYKSETAMIAQSLDLLRTAPCHVLWTAHPLPSTKIESAGSTIKVTKVISIVTYGSKVAGMVPGQFSEIYHFSQSTNYNSDPPSKKYTVETNAVGDDFAKSSLGLPRELDITDRLFYEVWMEAVEKTTKESAQAEVKTNESTVINPFIKSSESERKWNPNTGTYE